MRVGFFIDVRDMQPVGRARLLVPRARARIPAGGKGDARHIAAVGTSERCRAHAVPRGDMVDRLRDGLVPRHDFRPVHHDGLHHGDLFAEIAVEARRIMIAALLHGDIHAVAQSGSRHPIDDDPHDDEHDDQRNADAHEHLWFQFHFSRLLHVSCFFFSMTAEGREHFSCSLPPRLYTLYRSFHQPYNRQIVSSMSRIRQ